MGDSRDTKCPICGGLDWRKIIDGPCFHIEECAQRCIGRTVPPPTLDLSQNSPPDADGIAGIKDLESGHFRLARELLDDVARIQPSGRLLDVGCGWGHLLKLALDMGYDAVGLDASQTAVDVAETAFQVKPILSLFPGYVFEPCSFDIVTMNHVLEHLPRPESALSEAWRILKPEGVLAIGVPNFDSLMRRVRGANWQGIQPSQHVWQYTARSVAKLLCNAGFTLVGMRCISLEYPRGPRSLPKWLMLKMALATSQLLRIGDNAIVIARKQQ